MNEMVDVIKLNLMRQETWRYSGEVLYRKPQAILLQALFNREDTAFHGIMLGRGDRFVEAFYADRWYNIFEMHDRDDNHLKGWYCNVCLPAEFEAGRVSYVDLALDLLVFPDGRQIVLDEDEFASLVLDTDVREQALAALGELETLFRDAPSFRLKPDPSL